jgi:hypothetical protein
MTLNPSRCSTLGRQPVEAHDLNWTPIVSGMRVQSTFALHRIAIRFD